MILIQNAPLQIYFLSVRFGYLLGRINILVSDSELQAYSLPDLALVLGSLNS